MLLINNLCELTRLITYYPRCTNKQALSGRLATACVRKTCASSLFSAVVKEKLTRDWTGHWSFKYEKISEVKSAAVSEVLTVT